MLALLVHWLPLVHIDRWLEFLVSMTMFLLEYWPTTETRKVPSQFRQVDDYFVDLPHHILVS